MIAASEPISHQGIPLLATRDVPYICSTTDACGKPISLRITLEDEINLIELLFRTARSCQLKEGVNTSDKERLTKLRLKQSLRYHIRYRRAGRSQLAAQFCKDHGFDIETLGDVDYIPLSVWLKNISLKSERHKNRINVIKAIRSCSYKDVIFAGVILILAIIFVALQVLALQFFMIGWLKLMFADVFLLALLGGIGFLAYFYIVYHGRFRSTTTAQEIGLNKVENEQKTMKSYRGIAVLCMWISAFWIVSTIASGTDFGLLLVMAITSIIMGANRGFGILVYMCCLPLVLMFLGTWCHFDPLAPIGMAMVFVNIGVGLIYHYLVAKYLQ